CIHKRCDALFVYLRTYIESAFPYNVLVRCSLNKQVITCNAQQVELGVNDSHYAITHVNYK
ncbi:unnamed protein product, partial [Brassica rapa subsp. trilocularis]